LPIIAVIMLLLLSLIFIGIYSIQGIFQGKVKHRLYQFALRIVIVYGVTLLVVLIILIALNRMPLFDEPLIALKRVILLSFPASMGGVIVDGFDKE